MLVRKGALMDLKELGNVNPNTHWYYQSKYIFMRNAITTLSQTREKCLVEVGAGSGFFSNQLATEFKFRQVIQIDTNYAEAHRITFEGFARYNVCPHLSGDIYLFIDVVEHVPNPIEFLAHYISEAREGSTFVITVPAFQFLWSDHDIYLGHFKRYTVRDLVLLATEAGLMVEKANYIFALLFPIAFLQRKLVRKFKNGSAIQESSKFTNLVLMLINRFEAKVITNQRYGLSVLLVAHT
jgi:2-polyprenyl-3-methyl-5-hydroxy-6-metoxy-1,4-benzoquinol methylase